MAAHSVHGHRDDGHKMKLLTSNDLLAGDVLLCYKDAKFDLVGKGIAHVTNSEYTHAAICIDTDTAAESVVGGGVTKVKIQALTERYDHVAVFRQPDAWRPAERIKALNEFINRIIASKAKYNLWEVATFKTRSEVHQLSLTERLSEYFQGTFTPDHVEKGSYFCSELVVDCFVVTGFIEPSAGVVYKSNVTSPGALGRDATFGTFCGYVSAIPNYTVPKTDEFFNASTFHEIFGNDA